MLQKVINIFKKELTKPTPFLLLGALGIVFFSFVFFALLPDQTAGLGVAYAFLIILALLVAVLLDRMVVRKLRLLPIIYSEIIFILMLYAFIMFSSRTTKLVVTTDIDHFVIAYMEGGKTADDFKLVFPFDKQLEINNQACIVLDKSLEDMNEIEIEPTIHKVTDAWRGYSSKSDEVYLNGKFIKVKIFWTGNTNADTDEFLDCIEQL